MIGRTISHYTILEELGRGGMGIVYKAEDTKLRRTVALKFLPPELVRDEGARERFIHEARAASALDHTNICTIYEIDEADGHYFIAMAFVEGRSLKEILKGGPLPLGEAIALARDIASGLHEAHEKGIVHRDIKPSNIMVTPQGRAKILDFGLAISPGRAQVTRTGTTLGTVAYMSPEQARGLEVDRRSDLWSLGVVLYEMITGRRPFAGAYEQAVLYAILNTEPEPAAKHRTDVPTGLERIIARALDKNRETRYRSADELLSDISILGETSAGSSATEKDSSPRPRLVLYAAIAVCTIVALIFVASRIRVREKAGPAPEARQVTYTGSVEECALSPEGNYIAYTTKTENHENELRIKDLGSGSSIKVHEVWRCFNVSWSPDGSSLLFASISYPNKGGIYLVPRLGGDTRELIQSPWCYTAWSPDGHRIAYIGVDDNTIKVLDIATGVIDTISIDGVDDPLHFVEWSPDGGRLLVQTGTGAPWYIMTARGDGSDPQIIHEEEYGISRFVMHPTWSPDGKAVYYFVQSMRGRFVADLMKIAVDEKTGKARGEPVCVLSSLHSGADPGIGSFYSISQDGRRFAYVQLTQKINLWLSRVSGRTGNYSFATRQLTTGTKWKSRGIISPDGSRIAFSMGNETSTNIYTMALDEKDPQLRQLTFLNSINTTPAWSPDGETIAFYSDEGGVMRVWLVKADGGAPAPIESSVCHPEDNVLVWTPGGEILFRLDTMENFAFLDPRTGAVRPFLEGSQDPKGYLFDPTVSPDGRHIAFFRNRPVGGQQEYRTCVYSVDDGSARILLDNLSAPLKWSSDGRCVYCILPAPDDPARRSLCKVAFPGGEPEPYLDYPFITDPWISSPDMTMDGRTFVFQEIEEQSDVWIIDNFDRDAN
jgi:serine/threonine protein kinase